MFSTIVQRSLVLSLYRTGMLSSPFMSTILVKITDPLLFPNMLVILAPVMFHHSLPFNPFRINIDLQLSRIKQHVMHGKFRIRDSLTKTTMAINEAISFPFGAQAQCLRRTLLFSLSHSFKPLSLSRPCLTTMVLVLRCLRLHLRTVD